MRSLFTCLIVILFHCSSTAQDWRTIAVNDTTYFRGSKGRTFQYDQIYNEDHPIDSGKLRVIFVNSVTPSGNDTTFHFYTSYRDTAGNGECIDTLGASWLGHQLVSSNDGFDHYFNKFDDTISIKRHAAIGDTWTIAHDINGIEFRGTVMEKGLMNVESISDSFQTLTIQAFQNNLPIADHYNGKKLKWTKHHGWITALDLYRFPNDVDEIEYTGTITDTGQLYRLDHFARMDLSYIDLAWKYAPGNEFIYRERTNMDEEIWYDSVITATLLDTNTIIVNFFTEYYQKDWMSTPGPPPNYVISGSSYYHTDTITKTNVPHIVKYHNLPDVKNTSYGLYPNYFANTFCDGRPILKYFTVGLASGSFEIQNCVSYVNGISGGAEESNEVLYGFGSISNHQAQGIAPTWWDALFMKHHFTYIKTQDCEWGTKIDVLALRTEDLAQVRPSFQIYPNPARENVTLQSSIIDNNGSILLMDITGRVILQKNSIGRTNTFNTGHLSKGMYLIKVATSGSSETSKIIVE